MDKMNKLISTLPDEDVRKAKEWIEKFPDDVPKNPEEAFQKLITSILWDYKSRAESAPAAEAMEINKKKATLYKKWKDLGLV